MSVVRIAKRKNPYVILDKTCLNDPSLRLRTKGLHAYLLSLPDEWKVNMTDLENRSSDGREAVRGAMAELIKTGYVERNRVKDEDGRMQGWEYVVYEAPKQSGLRFDGTERDRVGDNERSPDEVSEVPSVPAPNKLWMRKYFAAWSRGTGGALLPAKWLKDGLRTLEDTHGEDNVYDAFVSFTKSKDAQYGPKQFIQNFGKWNMKKTVKIADALGD